MTKKPWKTIPFGAAHTYMAHIGSTPSPGDVLFLQLEKSFVLHGLKRALYSWTCSTRDLDFLVPLETFINWDCRLREISFLHLLYLKYVYSWITLTTKSEF